jgi:hypothetical protein
MREVPSGVARPPSENSSQIAIRLPEEWLTRADALAPWITRPGIAATRSDVLRAAIARGLESLEAERATDAKSKKPAKK